MTWVINGQRSPLQSARRRCPVGRNTIAILASHHGRDKACGYMGTLETPRVKGIFGPVELTVGGKKTQPFRLGRCAAAQGPRRATGSP